jgi:hypothetical protein
MLPDPSFGINSDGFVNFFTYVLIVKHKKFKVNYVFCYLTLLTKSPWITAAIRNSKFTDFSQGDLPVARQAVLRIRTALRKLDRWSESMSERSARPSAVFRSSPGTTPVMGEL